mmetsp:Transcript_3077/g.6535  ORF Transcript_3077/g.6535 Transcript_3077/m.6535 type:complete len:255 (-) Transcript_3077:1272-2036(-)
MQPNRYSRFHRRRHKRKMIRFHSYPRLTNDWQLLHLVFRQVTMMNRCSCEGKSGHRQVDWGAPLALRNNPQIDERWNLVVRVSPWPVPIPLRFAVHQRGGHIPLRDGCWGRSHIRFRPDCRDRYNPRDLPRMGLLTGLQRLDYLVSHPLDFGVSAQKKQICEMTGVHQYLQCNCWIRHCYSVRHECYPSIRSHYRDDDRGYQLIALDRHNPFLDYPAHRHSCYQLHHESMMIPIRQNDCLLRCNFWSRSYVHCR